MECYFEHADGDKVALGAGATVNAIEVLKIVPEGK